MALVATLVAATAVGAVGVFSTLDSAGAQPGEGGYGGFLLQRPGPAAGESADRGSSHGPVSTAALDRRRDEQIAGLRAARQRFPYCDLISAGSHLGIVKRVNGRVVPVRGAAGARAELFRTGPANALALGALSRYSASGLENPLGATSVVAQDTIRLLYVRIDFNTDRSGSQTTGDGHFDMSPPDTVNVPVDPTPHGRAFYLSHAEALKRYYDVTTHGRLVVEYDVFPQDDSAYHVGDMADFGPWNIASDDIFERALRMFRDFTVAADTQGVIPWDSFDRVTFIHAGSDLQSDVRQDSPNDIPTFTIGLTDSLAIPVADSTTFVGAGMILPETVNQDGFFAALNAVHAHEMGHLIFGWRDVYNVNNGFPVCGLWTLMDTGNLVGTIVQVGQAGSEQLFFAIGLLPPLTDPYQMNLVWNDVPSHDPPAPVGVDLLLPRQLSRRTVKVPLSSEEYLLLENRKFDLNGDNQIVLIRDPDTGAILGPSGVDSLEYDFLLPGEGILAWHVDESVVAFDPPGRRIDEFFTLNGNPDRRGLQIFEADGLDDLGDFTSPLALGSPFDPFFLPDNDLLAPGGRPRLITTSGTEPHVQISFLDSLKMLMRLRVTREWTLPGWPVVVKPPPGGVHPLVIDFAAPVGRRVVFSGGDNALHALRADGSGAGPLGDVLWQAPEPLSTVAEIVSPTLGPLAVSVYPDPAGINDSTWSTNGSWVIVVDGNGNPAPGFPLRVADVVDPSQAEACRWVTANPIVVETAAGDPRIILGTRGGCLVVLDASGVSDSTTFGGGAFSAVVSLAAVHLSGVTFVAYADSTGRVGATNSLLGPACPGSLVITSGPAQPLKMGRPGWRPRLAWVELDRGSTGERQSGGPQGSVSVPQLVVLDPSTGEGSICNVECNSLRVVAELIGIDGRLVDGLAAGDLDGDGFNEIVLATEDGRVGHWNLTGTATPGWPGDFEPEHFITASSPLVANVNGTPELETLAITGSGRLYALDRDRRTLPGWPLGTGSGQVASPALLDVNGDGTLELLIGDADSLLYAFDLPEAPADEAPWPMWGGNPGRNFSLVSPPQTGAVPGGRLLVQGSLKCYPNPARRQPVVVSFALSEPADVRLTIFDSSGREVARLSSRGLLSDNSLVWDPAGHAPGLYLGRLEIDGATVSETHMVHMGILR